MPHFALFFSYSTLQNPHIADQYTEHTANVTVAKYSPSGFYIASGDVNGNVRIWDTTQAEHILKYEIKVIAGEIRDIAWDSESKRVIAVGNGQERFGHAFSYDSGSSVGEITGHSKTINSADIKPTRPFRAVTVSDDLTVGYFEGPPFKYKQSNKEHTRFVNCVRFSPNGEHFATVGSDMKIFLFDGKTGERVAELGGEGAHTGSIFSCSWSPDSKQLLTASADKTVKLWNIESRSLATCAIFFFSYCRSPTLLQYVQVWQHRRGPAGELPLGRQLPPQPVAVGRPQLPRRQQPREAEQGHHRPQQADHGARCPGQGDLHRRQLGPHLVLGR